MKCINQETYQDQYIKLLIRHLHMYILLIIQNITIFNIILIDTIYY